MQSNFDNQFDDHGLIAEINMIPLIDVALVLLIIFMVLTPFLVSSHIQVELPKASSSVTTDSNPSVLEVYVAKDGSINIKGRTITIEKLDDTIKVLTTKPKLDTVLIKADKESKFENIVAVMDSAKKNGLRRLGVCVKKTDGKIKSK